MERCLFCGQIVKMIWVHGHYQCPRCHQVSVPCCNGETANNVSTSQQTTETWAISRRDRQSSIG